MLAVDVQGWIGAAASATTALIAMVAYARARRTVLAPLRTEVFKLQLASASKVLEAFGGKSEHDLKRESGLLAAADLNSRLMQVQHFNGLGFKLTEEAIADLKSEVGAFLFGLDAFDDFEHIDLSHLDDKPTEPDTPPAEKIDQIGTPGAAVAIPKMMVEWRSNVEVLTRDPLLPIEVVDALKNVIAVVDDGTQAIGEVRKELAPALASKALSPADWKWETFESAFSNRFLRLCPDLELPITSLMTSLRKVFALDEYSDIRRIRK